MKYAVKYFASYNIIGCIQQELGDYTSALQSHKRVLEYTVKHLGKTIHTQLPAIITLGVHKKQ